MNQNTLLNILADMSLNDMTEAEDIRYSLIDLAECAEVDEIALAAENLLFAMTIADREAIPLYALKLQNEILTEIDHGN
jgi:hypothetical protein